MSRSAVRRPSEALQLRRIIFWENKPKIYFEVNWGKTGCESLYLVTLWIMSHVIYL